MIPILGAGEFPTPREVLKDDATWFTPWLPADKNVLLDLLGIESSFTINDEKVGTQSWMELV